ncbi:MAG: hypothetical protein AB7T06_24720 [Kofleriaceae bacterium]
MTTPGYKEARLAVQSWLKASVAANELVGVQRVYKDAPWWIAGPTFEVTPLTFGAALFVHIDRSRESRITIPAPDPQAGRSIDSGFVGQKLVQMTISVGIVYRYVIPSELTEEQLEDEWVTGLDGIIDGIKNRLRRDPLIGTTADTVFQAGQDDNDISIDHDLPTLDGGHVMCFARIQFSLDQIITA